MIELDREEARVVGSLAEKQLTTPQYYPLTLNALVNACNQSNNRDPVVAYDQATVEETLGRLRAKGVARVIHAGGGNRTVKYRHVLDEQLGLDRRELALVTVLLLRGPQTLNELRTRTERMADFEDGADVERDLTRLSEREEPLVVRLERQPGRKEARYATLVTPLPDAPAPTPASPRSVDRSPPCRPPQPRLKPVPDNELSEEQLDVLTDGGPTTAGNLHATLIRHPALARRWRPLASVLLDGELPGRLRELAILRTAWQTRSDYEWGHHVLKAREAGLSEEEIGAVDEGPDGASWSALERSVLRAADELHERFCLSDTTWSALAAGLDERQLIELVFVIGHYHLVAFALNALGIAPEAGLPEPSWAG